MKAAAITSVINFCSNDFRFLRACIEGVRPFSEQILITVCDHFYDGNRENYALLEHVYRQFPDVKFIEFAFDPLHSYRYFSPHYPEHYNWRHEWANTGRWISYYYLPADCEWIYFLDADEIIDKERFVHWLHNTDIAASSALSFSSHWYFREARYQADQWDDISLMVKRSALSADHLWSSDERTGILIGVNGEKKYRIRGLDEKPLVHHYSWVRSKDELRKKFTSWSHHWERSWLDLLDIEYENGFQGTDFIRGYTYRCVEPYFDPLLEPIPNICSNDLTQHQSHIKHLSNVMLVDRKEMQRTEIMHYATHS